MNKQMISLRLRPRLLVKKEQKSFYNYVLLLSIFLPLLFVVNGDVEMTIHLINPYLKEPVGVVECSLLEKEKFTLLVKVSWLMAKSKYYTLLSHPEKQNAAEHLNIVPMPTFDEFQSADFITFSGDPYAGSVPAADVTKILSIAATATITDTTDITNSTQGQRRNLKKRKQQRRQLRTTTTTNNQQHRRKLPTHTVCCYCSNCGCCYMNLAVCSYQSPGMSPNYFEGHSCKSHHMVILDNLIPPDDLIQVPPPPPSCALLTEDQEIELKTLFTDSLKYLLGQLHYNSDGDDEDYYYGTEIVPGTSPEDFYTHQVKKEHWIPCLKNQMKNIVIDIVC